MVELTLKRCIEPDNGVTLDVYEYYDEEDETEVQESSEVVT